MTVKREIEKVDGYKVLGLVFSTEEEAKKYLATFLIEEYTKKFREGHHPEYILQAFVRSNPKKLYEILKEVYG